MKWGPLLGLAAVLAAGCSRKSGTDDKSASASKQVPAVHVSQGFKARTVHTPPEPLTEAEKQKVLAVRAAGKARAKTELVPEEMRSRVSPKDTDPKAVFAIYRDGQQVATVKASEIPEPVILEDFLAKRSGGPVRAILVHSETSSQWLRPEQFGAYQLRINKRGLAKLELGGKKADRMGGKEEPGSDRKKLAKALDIKKSDLRAEEMRGVTWIEIRSPESPRLESEPG